MPLAIFQAAIGEAIDQGEAAEALAYVTLLWHTGVRKSEAYERKMEDVTVTTEFVSVDFHKRKKGGEEVAALDIPRSAYGVQEYLVPWVEVRKAAKKTTKKLFYQLETDSTRTTAKGKTVKIKTKAWTEERALWLFPNISSTTAWLIVKRILGPNYYPHYLRLRKLSAIASNPQTATIMHIKNFSGLKTLSAIGAYMGTNKQLQKEAMEGTE